MFWQAADLERGPLSLARTTEELLEGKVAALTSSTSGGRSVGIVRSRTESTEFSLWNLNWSVSVLNLHRLRLFICLSTYLSVSVIYRYISSVFLVSGRGENNFPKIF
jgi:hypothetical protein